MISSHVSLHIVEICYLSVVVALIGMVILQVYEIFIFKDYTLTAFIALDIISVVLCFMSTEKLLAVALIILSITSRLQIINMVVRSILKYYQIIADKQQYYVFQVTNIIVQVSAVLVLNTIFFIIERFKTQKVPIIIKQTSKCFQKVSEQLFSKNYMMQELKLSSYAFRPDQHQLIVENLQS